MHGRSCLPRRCSIIRGKGPRACCTTGAGASCSPSGESRTSKPSKATKYLVYRSDEHGFHNPPGVWPLRRLDVAAVDDSFTQGASVPSDCNLVAVIRRRWPSTLNLGYGGNGPLIELATLLEYLPERRPRVVRWVLCEANDVGEDLTREIGSALLRRYWREGRNLQHLEERQAEIDTLLRSHVERVRLNISACVRGLREVAEAGTELILLNPLFDEAEQMERLAAEVVPKLS